jgi:LysM domain-containing protein
MMPTSRKSIVATATVLALACSGLALWAAAQEDQAAPVKQGAAASPSDKAPELVPAPAPSSAAAPAAPAAKPARVKRAASGSEPSTLPPRNLKKVGDHWTPYDPPDPESFPPDATLHIIVPGETLWGLSDLSYNNPYLWPQLWDQNRYITDSHWIYPGDPLLVPPRPQVVTEREGVPTEIVPQGQEGAPATALDDLEGEDALEAPLAAETPQARPAAPAGAYPGGVSESAALVDRDELRCSGYIDEDSERGDLYIAENDEPVYENVAVGSLLYLNRGSNDPRIVPGAVFSVVEREGTIHHPVTGRTQGKYYRRSGEVRVLKVLQDAALATVIFACDEIRVGDELRPVDVTPVPVHAIPPLDPLQVERNGKPTGYVIHTRDSAVNVATGDMAQVDLGREDGIAPGDFLTAFAAVHSDKTHTMPDYHYKYGNQTISRPDLHTDDGRDNYPPLPVAQLVVVTVGPHTATVKIVYALREIAVGTMVEVN